MKAPNDGCQSFQSRRIRNPLSHWLSFFVPEKRYPPRGQSAPVVILTDEKRQPPDKEGLGSDSDCACE